MRILTETLKRLTDQKWINLFEVEYRQPSGNVAKWQFASRKATPKLSADPLNPDAVFIVPLLATPAGPRLVMTREFRVPLGDYEHSFPAGLCDGGESIEETVRRELFEETGLRLTRIGITSPPVVASAGLSDESAAIVFVECEGEPHTRNTEQSEDIEILLLDFAEVCRLRKSTEKFSAKAWLVLLMFESLGKLAWPACWK
jgi:ADP-ribose pyrophosphatase